MTSRPRDGTSLTAGIVFAALGVLLLLDGAEAVELRFAYIAPAVTATVGAILVAHGLGRSRER